jgi:hypothetical protein
MNEAVVWLGFLDLNAQRHGGEYAPLQPPEIRFNLRHLR